MAEPRTARLVASRAIGSGTRWLRFAVDGELGFTGGQYIIVNTRVPIGDGKVAKRAYSLLSRDNEQNHFEIAVRRVDSGPGSNYMLEIAEGSTLQFTGPWGKFVPARAAEAAEVESPRVVVIATDTGITAALGLLGSRSFEPFLMKTSVHWLVESDDYFLPLSFVRERLPEGTVQFERTVATADAPDRADWYAREEKSLLDTLLREKPAAVFLSGDGFLLSRFRDALTTRCSVPPMIAVESFFHHQELKAAAGAASS